MMERIEFVKWKKKYGSDLQIGSEVRIKTTCKYYESVYDEDQVYIVTCLYVDDGGLNIGVNEGGWRWSCDADGYRIEDLEPR